MGNTAAFRLGQVRSGQVRMFNVHIQNKPTPVMGTCAFRLSAGVLLYTSCGALRRAKTSLMRSPTEGDSTIQSTLVERTTTGLCPLSKIVRKHIFESNRIYLSFQPVLHRDAFRLSERDVGPW